MVDINFKYIIIYIGIFLAFAVDRVTKYYFVNQATRNLVVFDNLLILELHKNKGVAFGLLVNNIIYYILFGLVFLFLIYLLVDSIKKKNIYIFCCLIFIIIGAASNVIDRIRFGAVIDFINVPFWSVFNLADCYIVVAVIFWLVYLFKHEKKISKKS